MSVHKLELTKEIIKQHNIPVYRDLEYRFNLRALDSTSVYPFSERIVKSHVSIPKPLNSFCVLLSDVNIHPKIKINADENKYSVRILSPCFQNSDKDKINDVINVTLKNFGPDQIPINQGTLIGQLVFKPYSVKEKIEYNIGK